MDYIAAISSNWKGGEKKNSTTNLRLAPAETRPGYDPFFYCSGLQYKNRRLLLERRPLLLSRDGVYEIRKDF